MRRLPVVMLFVFLFALSVAAQVNKKTSFVCSKGHTHPIHDVSLGTPSQLTQEQMVYLVGVEDANCPKLDYGYHVLRGIYIGSIVADLVSTWSLPPGWTEGNIILGKSKTQQVAVSASLAALTMWLAHRQQSRGHTKTAKFILLFSGGVHSGCAVYNATRR